jgi:hypothetical protein
MLELRRAWGVCSAGQFPGPKTEELLTLELAIVDDLRTLFKGEQVLGKNDVPTKNITRKRRESNLTSKAASLFEYNLQFNIDKIG